MKKSLIKPLFLTSAILSGVVAANVTYAPVAQADNVAVAQTEAGEEEYYVNYQVRNEAGEVINVLQSETWTDWAAMEEASVVVANQFGEELGFGSYAFNVDATADGLTYYFVQADEVEEETEYTVVYEVRDEEGHVLEVLQTETWTDWDAMEEASVVVANQFGKDLGFGEFKFNVDATPEGLTYYFVEGEQEDVSSEDSSVESTDETTSSSEGSASSESDSVEETSEEESESKAKIVPGKKGPGKPGKMLPNTGDRSFFGAAALSFLAGFGLMAVRKSKKDA